MKTAVLQFSATNNEARNFECLAPLIRAAAAEGAGLVVLPEAAYYRGKSGEGPADAIPGRATAFIAALAREKKIWIHGGSCAEASGDGRRYNTAFLVSPEGEIVSTYRKIHLFDIDLPETKVMESEYTTPGTDVSVARLGSFTAASLVCYDLRFPGIWARLRAMGADLFFLPANFTKKTGEAHWEILLRARAIETQSFVLAAAQWGVHPRLEIPTYGRAMIVDPWGRILAETPPEGDGFAIAEIAIDRVLELRRSMPVFEHLRPEAY